MSVPFVTRDPTLAEMERLRLVCSTYCDGSGMVTVRGGMTIPGWRDFERAFAAVFGGSAPEGKQVFDVFFPSSSRPGVVYGASLKSKQLSRAAAIGDLASTGRVFMELANSPAKFFAALRSKGITEQHFAQEQHGQLIGETVLEVVSGWHQEDARRYNQQHSGRILDLESSVYATISYSKARKTAPRRYQIHSFPLSFPARLKWTYSSNKCLRAMDPDHPQEVLFDLYGRSGGQLKYYPRAAHALFASPVFELQSPPTHHLGFRAARYWPNEWRNAGGIFPMDRQRFAEEIENLSVWLNDTEAVAVVREALVGFETNTHHNSN